MTDSIQSLKAQAVEITGLSEFGSPWFEGPLSAWVADLGGPLRTSAAEHLFRRLAVTNLCRRLEVMDCLHRHPEIDDVEVPPILYITGLERSGTTFLHNLLALHPLARALLRWELMRPVPPPQAETYLSDPRIAEVQATVDRQRGTPLEHMHWVNADDPEECTWGAIDCTGLMGRAPMMMSPTWNRWLATHDLTPSFVEYRRLIKLLIWRNPLPPGGHLVLKSPQNSRNIGQFAAAFPEAKFVLTHRDPFRAFTSVCALLEGTLGPICADHDYWRSGGPGMEVATEAADRALSCMVAHDQASLSKVVSVAYPQLVQTPAEVVAEIYRAFDMEVPTDLDARIETFTNAQASGKGASPPTALPTFGQDHAAFLARPTIAAYCFHFQVEPETTRLTGA